MRSQCLNILLQRKKARDKGCKVNVKSTERQTWIKKKLQILSFFSANMCDGRWDSLIENLPLIIRKVLKRHLIWVKQELFATLWHRSVQKRNEPLAVAISHVNHTHIKPKLITTMNSFARFEQKICPSTIYTAYQYILATKERQIYWHQNVIYISGEGERK